MNGNNDRFKQGVNKQLGGVGYSQIIWAENADVCRSYGLCLQAATFSDELVVFKFREVLLPGISFTVRCQLNP